MIGVCPEMKKIYLYLRVTGVAEHELLWCGVSSPSAPQLWKLIFSGKILAHAPRCWLKFSAVLPLASQVLASQTRTRSPSFRLVSSVCSCLLNASVESLELLLGGQCFQERRTNVTA